MRSKSTLHELCLAVLDTVTGFYEDQGLILPKRRVVPAGVPSWDCELVAVWSEGTYPHAGDIMREEPTPLVGMGGGTLRGLSVCVTICRCCPDVVELENGEVKWPSDSDVTETGRLVHEDEPLVTEAIRAGAAAGSLPNLNDWGLLNWSIVGPMGGFVASEMRLRVATDWMPTPITGS